MSLSEHSLNTGVIRKVHGFEIEYFTCILFADPNTRHRQLNPLSLEAISTKSPTFRTRNNKSWVGTSKVLLEFIITKLN